MAKSFTESEKEFEDEFNIQFIGDGAAEEEAKAAEKLKEVEAEINKNVS